MQKNLAYLCPPQAVFYFKLAPVYELFLKASQLRVEVFRDQFFF
jgi:hypothetical protein